ncbi:hypothetical protein PCASD_01024 [Puccinia coronata f. sp. avenae]|uniref:TRP C-terminal domain-containing protein n=1 Tax=Puccinia coronata f. sp. avenae TaxID=200324 RepID=A0A2N5VMV3_9BASI|nr:hypothetical protein PCASD_01024 [Puccinia coronata f. sp. avenae]
MNRFSLTLLYSVGWLLLLKTISSQPLQKSFTSCLTQHLNSLAPNEQLIQPSRVWTQLQEYNNTLRITLIANVNTQSTGYSSQTNFLATLISETSLLNFQLFSNQSALCNSIRTSNYSTTNPNTTESGCPYGPGEIALGVQLPLNYHPQAHPFTTLSTQLQLLDTSTPALTLACIQIDTTPYYNSPKTRQYNTLIKWLPIALLISYLIVSYTARIWATILSEQLNREAQLAATNLQQSATSPTVIPSSSSSSPSSPLSQVWWLVWAGQGLLISGALLRFSTPNLRDLLNHIQFITLLGLFSVQWPEFIYPVLTQSAWSTLIFNTTLIRTKYPNSSSSSSSSSSSLLPPNPLNTPPYEPPQAFVSQFDNPTSPLYLNRSLPNVLLNYPDDLPQGIPRWATTIGILPRDLFGVAISIFALCCAIIALFSALFYLFALIATWISRQMSSHSLIKKHDDHHHHHHQQQQQQQQQQRDSTIFNSADTDDGRASSPLTTTRLFHDKMKQKNSPDKRHSSLFDSISSPALLLATTSIQWPSVSYHFALLQGNLLRLFILFYLPLVVFSSYQLTLIHTASIPSVAIAACTLATCAVVPIVQLYRLKGRSSQELIDNITLLLTLGPLYNTFDDKNQLFMAVRFSSSFIVGVVIGAAQSHGIVQAVVLLMAELTETMLTSLWLPWGEGAAMAPLTFISSVSRIITAIILVVLTPTVAVGSVASGWLAYVVLLILGGVLGILLCVLVVKLIELLLRLAAHIPFDETRSTRAGGLRGAWRRWDRTTSRSTRHGRAAAIAARRHRRARRKSSASAKLPQKAPVAVRTSIFSALNVQSPNHADKAAKELSNSYPSSSLAPGFMMMNDDDGGIMSAMSQGPWVRPAVSESMYGGGGGGGGPTTTTFAPSNSHHASGAHHHQQQQSEQLVGYPSHHPNTPSSGFAVVRGGRATEKTPYEMHNDGRNHWRPSRLPHHDYPPSSQHARPAGRGSSPDFQHHPPPHEFYQTPAGHNTNASRTTTNLFESSPFQLNSSSDHEPPRRSRNSSSSNSRRRRRRKAPQGTMGLLGLFRRGGGRPSSESSESSESSSESSEDDDDEEDDWDDESGSDTNRDGQQQAPGKLRGLIGGLGRWRRQDPAPAAGAAPAAPAPAASSGFQVVRQPRPRPAPAPAAAALANPPAPSPPLDTLGR